MKDPDLLIINEPNFNYRQCELFSAPKKNSKKCKICRIEKDLSNFYLYTFKIKFGERQKHSRNCKTCDREVFCGRYATSEKTRAKVKKKNKKYRGDKKAQILRYRRQPINRMKALMTSWIGRRRLTYAIQILGYNPEKLVEHLTANFQPGMSWENYGFRGNNWNVDHIKPCCLFNLSDTEQFIKCHQLANLKPEWANINQNKSGKYCKLPSVYHAEILNAES